MGFISGLVDKFGKSTPAVDPQMELIRELLTDQRQQRQEMSQLLGRVLDQAQEQAQLANSLLNQYVAVGENQTTTLDSRLFAKDQKIEEDLREPLGVNPFKGLVE